MGKKFEDMQDKQIAFIQCQKIFFVGTAASDGRVNISPKGMDSLRVINKNRVVWLNVTGSGNETSAHIQENSRMTILFAGFEGAPMILRLYGHAEVIHRTDAAWVALAKLFDYTPGARQIFDLSVDLVQVSCGMSVPLFDYVDDREHLKNWAKKKGETGVKQYWEEKNQTSIDGKPTNIVKKNG